MQTIEEALEPLRRECDRWQAKEQDVREERNQLEDDLGVARQEIAQRDTDINNLKEFQKDYKQIRSASGNVMNRVEAIKSKFGLRVPSVGGRGENPIVSNLKTTEAVLRALEGKDLTSKTDSPGRRSASDSRSAGPRGARGTPKRQQAADASSPAYDRRAASRQTEAAADRAEEMMNDNDIDPDPEIAAQQFKEKRDQMYDQLQGALDLNRTLQGQLDGLNENVAGSDQRVEDLERKNRQLRQSMEQMIQGAGDLDEDMKQNLLSALDRPIPNFGKILGDSQNESRSLRDNLKRKREEKQAIEQDLRRQQTENIAVRRQAAQLKQQQEELKAELNRAEREIEELQNRNKALKREKEEYKHKAEMDRLRQSAFDWKKKREQMQEERGSRRQGPSEEEARRMRALESKAMSAEGRVQNLKNAEMKLRAELQSIDTVSKSRSDTLRQMGAKLEEHFDKFNVEMREFQTRERQLREQKRDVEEDLRGAQSQVQQLKASNVAMEQQLNDLTRSLKRERSRSPSKRRAAYEPFSDITSISSAGSDVGGMDSKMAELQSYRDRRRPKAGKYGERTRPTGRRAGAQNLDALRQKFGIAPNRAPQYSRGRRQ